ncbi:tyrosine-type recombinase/integrase [Christensenella hongkongensis]|uniref:tyrosine-type recombinase/integrase n=1 Tax=Christensenella hongkongensis TaxID=270498 RepID=UPI0039B8B5F5
MVEVYGENYDDNDIIIKRNDGKRFDLHYLNDRLKKILIQNNLPIVTLHELRHSTASLLRSMGFSVFEIQSWLRHSDIDATLLYAHDNLANKEKTANILSDRYFANIPSLF